MRISASLLGHRVECTWVSFLVQLLIQAPTLNHTGTQSKRDNLILGFVNDLKKCASDSSRGGYAATQKRLLLRTLGNIGSLLDLSSHDSLLESVLSCFDGDENVSLFARVLQCPWVIWLSVRKIVCFCPLF